MHFKSLYFSLLFLYHVEITTYPVEKNHFQASIDLLKKKYNKNGTLTFKWLMIKTFHVFTFSRVVNSIL